MGDLGEGGDIEGRGQELTGGRHVREATRVLQVDTAHRMDHLHLRYGHSRSCTLLRMDDRCELHDLQACKRRSAGVLM